MPKVLLVDDDVLSSKVIAEYFAARDIQINSVESGEAAWEQLQKDHDFSAILIDILMPGMSGLELLKKIKMLPETRAIPCICVTNLISDATTEMSSQLGALACLFKDHYPPQALVDEIIRLVPALASGTESGASQS